MKFSLPIFIPDKMDKKHKVMQQWHKVSAAKDVKCIASNISWLPDIQVLYMQGQRWPYNVSADRELLISSRKCTVGMYSLTIRNEYIFYLTRLANCPILSKQSTAPCGSSRWCFCLKQGLPHGTPALWPPGLLEQLQPGLGAPATEKLSLLLLFKVSVLFCFVFFLGWYLCLANTNNL